MRIDSNPRALESDPGQAASGGPRANPATSGSPALGSDTAQLSTDQARVQALAVQASALPEIRQDKVDALRRVVRDGSYRVSPEQTAEAMLSEIQIPSAA